MLPRPRRRACRTAVLVAALLVVAAPQARAQDPAFEAWVEEVRAEAARRNLNSPEVQVALADVRHVDPVIELDRRQPELTQTFWRYTDARITDARIAQGQTYLDAYAPLLSQVYARWGVPPPVLVALWGLESDFGRIQGDFEVVSSVATLAYDSRRSGFFRQQLFAALELIDSGDLTPDVRGSWAGAIGQPQFIPTTIRGHAVDFDGDGLRDLRGSLSDVFASAANYLHASGWNSASGWGEEVRLPVDFDYLEAGLEVEKPTAAWQALGVRRADGSDLPNATLPGTVLLPAGINGPAFLVHRNFRVILKWNNSVLYALAVGMLSDRLAGIGPLLVQRWGEEVPLTRYDVVELQSRLTALGFEPGEPDGVVGEKTRRAIRLYQRSVALPADGYPDPGLLQQLRGRVTQ
ncbi:MAG TPA: lytic murein transglycosylase [Rhodospirillales bacterium]|nr:lytic murein transglycosylase [Rhodospirillales bacterium]